jgi:hypothetical protein
VSSTLSFFITVNVRDQKCPWEFDAPGGSSL